MITQTFQAEEIAFGTNVFDNQTTLHALALGGLILLSFLTFVLPRKYALIPTLVMVSFIPSAQRIVILGLDFTLLRIIAMVGISRIFMKHEFDRTRWRRPDTVILVWAGIAFLTYSLKRMQVSASISILGKLLEALCLYFMVRGLIRSWEDLRNIMVAIVVVCVIVAAGFLNEKATGRNIFSVFGGVPEVTVIRKGRLRCQGAFPHPIIAGCFWAVLTSYAVSLWWSRLALGRLAATLALCAGLVIMFACSSSTPLAAFMAGCAGAAWFIFRDYTKHLRYLVVFTLIGLHMVMNAPVWHLIARLDLAGGSTGDHRYRLIDAAVSHFSEWAVLGTLSTGHWGYFLFDVANQFVFEGVSGGILRLIAFTVLVAMCFNRVGLLCRAVRGHRERQAFAWALGVGLLIHCVSFLGVSYFGQISFAWYFSMAAIVSMAEPYDRPAAFSGARRRPPDGQCRARGAAQRPGVKRSAERPQHGSHA